MTKEKIIIEAESIAQTFLSSAIIFIGAQLSLGQISWTRDFWVSLVLAAARSAVKVTWNSFKTTTTV